MFKRILIANRGEIACRIQRTCARLGIETVAIYSEADKDALHVRNANQAACVGPAPVRDSYLNIPAIIAAAKDTGAEAIHPGYGLLSEKAAFADAVRAAGLVFVGPGPEALDAFGDKIKARAVARSVGFSPPPGTDGPIAPDSPSLRAEAERIGLPLLVKAAGGGGGIGMQIVRGIDQLEKAVKTCSDRGKSAFADERVYLERYIDSPRHIEVQILCDSHGNAVALGDRECSMQRRHQKIIEESPSPASFFSGPEGASRRQALFDKAIQIARKVNYVGAGTVECVAAPDGEIYFLEVNARLQVEHCVTEMCTSVDLVEQQFRIASGEKLSADVLTSMPRGASIEVRIYAENPAKKFIPQPGRIDKLVWPVASPNLRIETGVEQGSVITPFYDPMIAKLVCWSESRDSAIRVMAKALRDTHIELAGAAGPAATNLQFLEKLIDSAEFHAGAYDTTLAERLAQEPPAPG